MQRAKRKVAAQETAEVQDRFVYVTEAGDEIDLAGVGIEGLRRLTH